MRTRATFGRNKKEGACNAPVDDAGWTRYCHRDDNGSGLCNVHEAAQRRGQRVRDENKRRRRLRRAAHTPPRSVRVPDDVWQAAKAEAESRGETVTDAIVRALRRYSHGARARRG